MAKNLLSPGSPAPDFELQDTQGRSVRFDPEAAGMKVLVFYKNSCPTCQFAMPYFDRLYRNTAPEQRSWIYAVSQDTPEAARAFADEYEIAMPQLVDPAPYFVSRQYGILNVPTLFVINEAGRVALVSPAFVKADLLFASRLLSPGFSTAALFSPEENVPELKPG